MDEINELNIILDRTIGFVRDCYTKTSITLGFIGLTLTILVTMCGDNLINFFTREIHSNSDFFIAGGLIVGIIIMMCGVLRLFSVFTVTLKGKDVCTKDSLIFFESISKKSCSEYLSAIQKHWSNGYDEDLITQIHINSKICSKRFKYYDKGLMPSFVGISILIVFTLLVVLV